MSTYPHRTGLLAVFVFAAACGSDATTPGAELTPANASTHALVPITHGAALVSHTLPASMAPGEVLSVRITLRNTGTNPAADAWPGNSTYRLQSTSQPSSLWNWTRTAVNAPVPVGGTFSFDLVLVAPSFAMPSAMFRAQRSPDLGERKLGSVRGHELLHWLHAF